MIKNYTYLRIANLVALAATVAINILANAIPLGGFPTSQISAMYPTLITPPGITFGIWGVIYVLLLIFMVVSFFKTDTTTIENIGPYFIISCALNIAWILAWHSQMIVLSTLIIGGLLLTLYIIYIATRKSTMITKITFSIYYAWITVATLLSIFIMVKTLTGNAPISPIEARNAFSMSPGDFTGVIIIAGDPEIVSYVTVFEYIMSIVAIAAITAITLLHLHLYDDIVYVATIMWVLDGIIIRQIFAVTPPTFLLIAALISVIVILFVVIKEIPISNRYLNTIERRN